MYVGRLGSVRRLVGQIRRVSTSFQKVPHGVLSYTAAKGGRCYDVISFGLVTVFTARTGGASVRSEVECLFVSLSTR